MALKLHQDHFIGEDWDDFGEIAQILALINHCQILENLYSSLDEFDRKLICCHEGDPLWRQSILTNKPSLLSLRRQNDPLNPEQSDHLVLSLTLRYMKFRVILPTRIYLNNF
jgi:hypothetical protein